MGILRVSFWHIESFRCAAEFGRYRGIADMSRTHRLPCNCNHGFSRTRYPQ